MKLIFESETELGRCDADKVNGHFGEAIDGWFAYAHTTATTSGSRGMLRIEQRCYLRSSECPEEIRDQNWVKPELTLEPVLGSRQQTLDMVQQLHQQFVARAQAGFAEESILIFPSNLSAPVESGQPVSHDLAPSW
jgi:hypothetical protein